MPLPCTPPVQRNVHGTEDPRSDSPGPSRLWRGNPRPCRQRSSGLTVDSRRFNQQRINARSTEVVCCKVCTTVLLSMIRSLGRSRTCSLISTGEHACCCSVTTFAWRLSDCKGYASSKTSALFRLAHKASQEISNQSSIGCAGPVHGRRIHLSCSFPSVPVV